MSKAFRVIIMIVVLFGTVGLAWNQVAWAATGSETTDQATLGQVQQSISPHEDEDCDEPENRDRPRCKEKERHKCKKNPKHCGSVKPPPHRIVIPVTGSYSVGGFCIISIALNDPEVSLIASLSTPLPGELPDRIQKVRQGCLLEYFHAEDRMNELPEDSGNTTICFAATPGKNSTVYFYNLYSPNPTWVALETTVVGGNVCASANESGVYVAAFEKP
jgi:hypothetical protein